MANLFPQGTSEEQVNDTFDEYKWLEGDSQTFVLSYKRNFIYSIEVNGQDLIDEQYEEDIENKEFTILDVLDNEDFIRVVYNTKEDIEEEDILEEHYVEVGYVTEGYTITQ